VEKFCGTEMFSDNTSKLFMKRISVLSVKIVDKGLPTNIGSRYTAKCHILKVRCMFVRLAGKISSVKSDYKIT